ncbi:hypothetical protein NBO_1117g0002 [Nosema bombycis CQ1]|uniref:Uncharacterized protein n=1 Tax=Nosema bombycis (strain CQ1 / CVCC 102059) TaxID=578461 RepID=R0KLK3_NOSB1|nr:hypothetical protein NBO_1117g0002 [Nosema bombycis CQ1]|eukprot:EOB11501.1 hypothetical protein NBO_1117g0002 [Nosema bombycis CQ1]
MISKLIYYFYILQCQNEKKETFTVILDRNNISDINITANPQEIGNDSVSKFLWDKYFPKPFFYSIDQNALFNSTLMKDAKDKNSLFVAKVDCTNETINTIKIDKDAICNEDLFKDYNFAIICKDQNIDSIKNTLIYELKVETIRPLYLNLVKLFVDYSNEIRNYRILVGNKLTSQEAYNKAWKAESLSIELTNRIVKGLALLNVPSRSKFEFMSHMNYYADQFAEIERHIGESLKDCSREFNLSLKIGLLDKNEMYIFTRIAKEHLEFIMSSKKEKSV